MTLTRAKQRPARGAILASVAGFVFLGLAVAIPASSQVLSGQPYVPPPDPAMERLESRLNQIESDLRKATGSNEQLTFQLNNARKAAEDSNARSKELQAQVDALTARVTTLEGMARGDIVAQQGVITAPAEATANLTSKSNGPTSEVGGAAKVDISTLPQDEDGMLKEARNLLLSGDYPSAQDAFSAYLKQYPKGASSDEAQYLLGESFLRAEDYGSAATAYGKLLSDYPKSDRGPEGLVKLARSMRLMGKKGEACKALGLMSTRFPKAPDTAKTLASMEKSRAGC
jgi:tol-pal system protein YbgF